jgi:hypothetical protein
MNISYITRLFKKESFAKTALGRWNINYKESMIKTKYATEDNCYLTFNHTENKIKCQTNTEDNYIFMMGYDSCV